MSDIEIIIKNSLLYTSDLCGENDLLIEMRNNNIWIYKDQEDEPTFRVGFRSKCIEIEVKGVIKTINLESNKSNQEVFDNFTKTFLSTVQRNTSKEIKDDGKENNFITKDVKDLKTKLLYYFLKITNKSKDHMVLIQQDQVYRLFKIHCGCISFNFYDDSVNYKPYISIPLDLTEEEMEEMVEDYKYDFIKTDKVKSHYSNWKEEKIDFKNKTVGEAYSDIVANIEQLKKNVENKKIKSTFLENAYT